MSALVIRELTVSDENAFREGLRVFNEDSLHWYTFVWEEGMSYQDHLQILADRKAGRNLRPGRVPDTMLYAFLDGKIIGRVSIRHDLTPELLNRGGHIGYWVHSDHRGKGYAQMLLKQGIEYCRSLGLTRVLITVGDDNTPSIRVIEKTGAQLENKIWDSEDEEMVRRYWLELEEASD